MAVNKYIQKCEYRLGGLKPYIYTVKKNAIQIRFKAKGPEVYWQKRNTDTVIKLEGVLVKYNQEEMNDSKFRFNNTCEIIVPEVKNDPFLYQLRTSRQNQEYIIIEDLNGTQYLINPELYTKFTYEYVFSDSNDNANEVAMTYNSLTNYPLLVMKEPIKETLSLVNDKCNYNLGKVDGLLLFNHKKLKTNDDGVKANEVYVNNQDDAKEIEYLKNSFKFKEIYANKRFKTELSFAIPLEKDQFNWHYNLIEYPDNKYSVMFHTTNGNYIIAGVEIGMSAKYNIVTAEEVGTPNMINITLTQTSQYPILFTDILQSFKWEAVEGDEMCFGFDRYQMLTQYKSTDGGDTWNPVTPTVKKKGEIIEKNSSICTEYSWTDEGVYCKYVGEYYEKWEDTDDFICLSGNKYIKTRKYISTIESPDIFNPTEEYGVGALLENNSTECNYVAVRWIPDTLINCYEVNEEYNRYNVKLPDKCVGTDLREVHGEEVTHNGVDYYPSGEEVVGDIVIENCCACGYYQEEERYVEDVCGRDIKDGEKLGEKDYVDAVITRVEGEWIKSEYAFLEFTSNKIKKNETTVERIYFTSTYDKLIIDYDQQVINKELNYLIVSNIDTTAVNDINSPNNYFVGNNKNNIGTIVIPIPNDNKEHFIEFMYRKCYEGGGISSDFARIFFNSHSAPNWYETKYELWQKYKVCDDGNTIVDEVIPNTQVYYAKERNSCDCGYREYEWRNEGTVCGSELGNEYVSTSLYEIWKEYKICPNDPNINELTGNVEYRNPISSCDCGAKFYEYRKTGTICGSEIGSKYTSTSLYEIWEEFEACSDAKTGNVEYRNPIQSCSCGYREYEWRNEGTVCGSEIGGEYVSTSMYEIWKEHAICAEDNIDELTGKIEYRNPIPSYDCGYQTYQWRLVDEVICGNAIPDGIIEEVKNDPETNIDKPYIK